MRSNRHRGEMYSASVLTCLHTYLFALYGPHVTRYKMHGTTVRMSLLVESALRLNGPAIRRSNRSGSVPQMTPAAALRLGKGPNQCVLITPGKGISDAEYLRKIILYQ